MNLAPVPNGGAAVPVEEAVERVLGPGGSLREAQQDALSGLEGVTGVMAVRFGEKDVKTLEDLAGLTPDDLRGWFETKNGERVREEGVLEGMNMSAEDAEDLIMRARVAAGWITQEDYEASKAPAGIDDLDDEARAEAQALIDAERLLKGEDGAPAGG